MAEIVILLNNDGELTLQTEGSKTEWITADTEIAMEIKR